MTFAGIRFRAAVASLWSERSLHLFVLCAFAFSEPLFSALTKQFVYLHDLGADWVEIGYVLVLLTIVIPSLIVVLDRLLVLGAARWRSRGQNMILGLLMALVWLSILRPFLQIESLAMSASIWLVSLVLAALGTVLTLQFYLRSLWFRRWLTVATVGVICFPCLFAYRYGSLRSAAEEAPPIPIEHPVPVIFIVFDEFSGATLMDQDLKVDAQRFPNFARLANTSTWYRHASTVHIRTDVAVPALLSGQYPTTPRPALEAEFPGNLFRVINATDAYDMTVFEPVTRLCPMALLPSKRIRRPRLQKIGMLTWTLSTVYPRLVFPSDMPIEFPPISRLWFGMSEKPDDDQGLRIGLNRTMPFSARENQLQSFLETLRPTEKPFFNFLHVEFPHLPWCFLPSGRSYNYDTILSFYPSGAWGEIGEDWGTDAAIVARNEHRYLQQLRYVDQFLGQLLDRLQKQDLLDDCLLIVTADHGVSFRPGHSRRSPDAQNLPDLLSIPLFIKLPGQSMGEISDRNVESVDVLPTIADHLGIKLPEPVDGVSIANESPRPRKTLYYNDHEMTVLEPAIPQLQAAVERRLAIFGTESLDRPPSKVSSHLAWHGRSTSEFQIDEKSIPSLELDVYPMDPSRGNAEFLRCLVAGTLDPQEFDSPIEIVLAVNDVICDSSLTFPKGRVRAFEFLVPEALALQHPCKLALFCTSKTPDQSKRLRRLKTWDLHEAL